MLRVENPRKTVPPVSMTTSKTCVDCQTKDGTFEIRKRFLCSDCVVKYVALKVLKRMETYRSRHLVGDHQTRLLLPLSGGPSSLSLLHTLDAQLQRQRDKGAPIAYKLVLVHVQLPQLTGGDAVLSWWERVTARYPVHQVLSPLALHKVFEIDSKIETDLAHLGLSRKENEDSRSFLSDILRRAKTPTAQSDLHQILLQRLIIAVAKQDGCDGILWGHSDSRLATQALANVAKGRGGAVPDAIADGPSPHGLVFNYPLRDLFRTEIDTYLKSARTDLSNFTLPEEGDDEAPVSIRQTSIDKLLDSYITTQGQKYPGIMANVVRTAGKLQLPKNTTVRCVVCMMPVTSNNTTAQLCYGCERMKQDVIKG